MDWGEVLWLEWGMDSGEELWSGKMLDFQSELQLLVNQLEMILVYQ